MVNIGEFARLGGVTPRMLRHYDDLGLLAPAHVDAHNSRRSYDVAQLTTLNQLVALKGLGFSLDEVGTLLREGVAPSELHGMLRLREADLERDVRKQRHTLDRVRARLRLIEQEPHMNVETKHVEPLTIAALTGDALDTTRQQTGAAVQALFNQVITQMETAHADRTTPIARYQPTARPNSRPEANGADADAATVQVTAGYRLSGEPIPGLTNYVLPATDVAAIVHHGPMDTISTAYQELARWAESTGRAPSDFVWREHYLEADGENQSHWIVEVQLELD